MESGFVFLRTHWTDGIRANLSSMELLVSGESFMVSSPNEMFDFAWYSHLSFAVLELSFVSNFLLSLSNIS
jgi:type III secretory pathway component EscR